jgi:hypothetical protein
MNTLHTYAPRLLAGFGTAALVAAVGLFASSRPAHTAGGPIPVSIANVPLPTTPTDEAAPRQPFVASTLYTISDGNNYGGIDTADGYKDITVPVGKRLVVQTVSLFRYNSDFSPPSSGNVRAFIFLDSGGGTGFFALPISSDDGTEYPGVTQAMTLYCKGGSKVSFTLHRAGTSGTEYAEFTVSGYLVNTP